MIERERTLLEALAKFQGRDTERWARPMDVGGARNTWHATYLARLVAKGWADVKRLGEDIPGRSRFTSYFRINAAGRKALANDKALREIAG